MQGNALRRSRWVSVLAVAAVMLAPVHRCHSESPPIAQVYECRINDHLKRRKKIGFRIKILDFILFIGLSYKIIR